MDFWKELLKTFRPSPQKYGAKFKHESDEGPLEEAREKPHDEDEEVKAAMRKPSERGSYGTRGGLR